MDSEGREFKQAFRFMFRLNCRIMAAKRTGFRGFPLMRLIRA
jgi:hypothetical protein